MVWPDLDDLEGRARFVLDDPSKAYLWQGLDACGCASVEAINRASELMSRDMYKLAQVKSPPLFMKGLLFVPLELTPCVVFDPSGAQSCLWRNQFSSVGSRTPGRPMRMRRLPVKRPRGNS